MLRHIEHYLSIAGSSYKLQIERKHLGNYSPNPSNTKVKRSESNPRYKTLQDTQT